MQRLVTYSLVGIMLLTPFFTACTAAPTSPPPAPPTATPPREPTPAPEPTGLPKPVGAFESGQYRNLFKEWLGKSEAEIQQKIDQAWQQLFYGDDDEQRVYYPVGRDMAYIKDIGNDDIRSEGTSYGMMLAVQLDKKEEFDRLWKWAHTYMLQKDGPYKGYFAWHNKLDGEQIDANPASDGEEWFVMALLFAANRWGNGEGIFNYQVEAQKILDTMLHKNEENTGLATNMFDPETKQVVFVPSGRNATFTDPSYHLPAFYELWALWADKDNDFWKEAAQGSRAFWKTAAHPQTGLMPDYAEFDGTPNRDPEHKDFRYDAFRNAANVAQDWAWFAADPWQVEQSNRLLDFFRAQGLDTYGSLYTLNGKPLAGDRSPGLMAMNAVAGLAADPEKSKDFVQALWDLDIPSGHWRYYDGLLYFLGLLHVSGNYRIYTPDMPKTVRPTPTPDPITQAKFVPRNEQLLFSVGQDLETVAEYVKTVEVDPGGVAMNTSLPRLEGIAAKADSGSGAMFLDELAANHPDSALILGLNVVDSLEAVNSGALDQPIDHLLDRLSALKRPVFLRFGYEFDKAEKRYDPEQYQQAWIKFSRRMKEKQIDNVALVWQSAADCGGTSDARPIEAWYPGDEFVAWVGLSYFAQAACDLAPANAVLNFARQHGKPVMIAGATPQGYDIGQLTYSTDGQDFRHMLSGAIWKEWFQPFFGFIQENTDVIKAVTYLNAPWNSQKRWGPPYANGYWGDARVQANRGVLEKWKAAITDARYLQAAPDLFEKLGYTPPQP
ncbi:Reducing-end xylose-releasing exo-oligoxylanase Rex8A [Thermoflexales bacterium]|nr:Reducing-end xylose-releasing exo-oligoxylanase Rex8A [Thermoflexales bacterium]